MASHSSGMTARCAIGGAICSHFLSLASHHYYLTSLGHRTAGLQFLPLKVPQELQDEEEPAQGQVDQGVQEIGRQGVSRGELQLVFFSPSHINVMPDPWHWQTYPQQHISPSNPLHTS